MLSIPAMERVHRLARICGHNPADIGEAPSIWVGHHHVGEVHAHVKEVRLFALELEPNHAVYIFHVKLLELLLRFLVAEVELAEDATVATHLKGLVDHVVEARSEHLLPFGTGLVCALQGEAHNPRIDTSSHTERGVPGPEICLVRLLLQLPGHARVGIYDIHELRHSAQVLLPHVMQRGPLSHKVPLRSRGGHGGRSGAAAIGDHSTLNVHDVLLGLELSLYLPARSHDVVFRWRRLLWSWIWHGRHFPKHPRLRNLESRHLRRPGFDRRILGNAWVDQLGKLRLLLRILALFGFVLHFVIVDLGLLLYQRCRKGTGWDGSRSRRPGFFFHLIIAMMLLLVLEVPHHFLVLSHGDRVILRKVAKGFRNSLEMAKCPLRAIIVDDLHDLTGAQGQGLLAIEGPVDLRGIEVIEGHHLGLIRDLRWIIVLLAFHRPAHRSGAQELPGTL
mmetsp:Transcript_12532/g.29910  ORF Transcript_12532/g.29910 Transcript_12532/m.29910 type:complete len:448 (+) Transcript_12532:4216-5559(+)